MLQPLPPGFPTPDPKDPESIGRGLGKASAMWMRGAYADAATKVDEVARFAADEHAKDSTRVDAARVASLLRVAAALSTLVEEMSAKGTTDPSSIAISLEFDTANLTDSELVAAQSLELTSADIESVRATPSDVAPARPLAPPTARPRTPRALGTTMQQASRPTIPDAPQIDILPEANVGAAKTIDLRRTLPEGVRDPRVPKPTPRPFPKVAVVTPGSTATVSSEVLPITDPFQDLDVPSSELGATTSPVPQGANYPPSEAKPSHATTRRAPEPNVSAEESTDPAPPPGKNE